MSLSRRLLHPLAFVLGLVAVGACSSSDPLPQIDDPKRGFQAADALLPGSHKGIAPRTNGPPRSRRSTPAR